MAANESRKKKNPPFLFNYVSGSQTQVATQIRAKGGLK
jgi:hypothetical protein